uniref:non-specific serine/threonine protein kinase n=1 Tax=Xiphophorus couchianus TaxID=32473 RepID=A0A3B5KRV9_9TELE
MKFKDAFMCLAEFQEKYTELHLLGKGGYGSVFAGHREVDKLPVAIKHIPKEKVDRKHNVSEQQHLGLTSSPIGFQMHCEFLLFASMVQDENGREMALEVAIMLKLKNLTGSSSGQLATVSLLDWYELEEELLIVMERPTPSQDLNDYLDENGGCLNEEDAKVILKQLVEAAIQLQDANIFHRDIKLENVLIERSSEGLQAYLIDFGLKYRTQKKYFAGPTTVWQLGVVLFEILHDTNFDTNKFLKKKLKISKRLPKSETNIVFYLLTAYINLSATLTIVAL